MKKSWIILGIAAIAVIIFVAWYFGTYNSLVRMDENANGQWAQVETQYQRRVDLIPNLVETVKGYAGFEKSTLTEITRLRSQWQTSSSPKERIDTANQIESTLSKLLIISENYPELKANQNFLALQDELANTENKIAVERGRFNDAVRIYNAKVRTFPVSIIAGMSGFGQREYFQSQSGAESAPKVNFA
jgi:LemA protein